jgi:CRISPR-associated protein Csy1
VFEEIKEHRFGDVAKTARESKRHNEYSDVEVHEYRNLAIQKLGGTKPQNISQLNSERRGENYLLASLPPIWKRRDVSAPFGATTIFKRFGRRRDVFLLIRDLKKFLESKPPVTTATREQRDYLLNRIKDYLYQYVGELHELEPGWSANKHCELSDDEKLWLDPLRATSDADFAAAWHRGQWIDEIKARFASWLNHALGGQLPFGDVEHTFWSDVFDDETWRQQIDAAKRNLQAREKSHV